MFGGGRVDSEGESGGGDRTVRESVWGGWNSEGESGWG